MHWLNACVRVRHNALSCMRETNFIMRGIFAVMVVTTSVVTGQDVCVSGAIDGVPFATIHFQ